MAAFNPYLQRLDEELESAAPAELILCLYRGLCERIAAAGKAMQAGQIRERAALISQSVAIVGELAQSLRPEADPELTQRLGQLYAFLIDRLLSANSQQISQPLEEALAVARVLEEGWRGVQSAPPPTTAAGFTGYDAVEAPQGRLSYCG